MRERMMTMLVVVKTISESARIIWIDIILYAVEMAVANNIVHYPTLNNSSNRNNDNLLLVAPPTPRRIYQSNNIATISIHMPNSMPNSILSRNPHPPTRIHVVMTQ
jgi:hypothetical protein